MSSSDLVFKKGPRGLEFVGDFEALYAAEADPWQQSGRGHQMREYYRESRLSLYSALKARFPGAALGLEVGCGLGYLTRYLNDTAGWTVEGMDVSETAIRRARSIGGGVQYHLGDISADEFNPPGQYDFVVLAQCWWYVLHRIEPTLRNCAALLGRGGLLAVSQAFLREQRYGREIADGFYGALETLMRSPYLKLVDLRFDDSDRLIHYDGLMIFRVNE